MDKIKRIEYLVEQLNIASDAYYGGKSEYMSNFEWDMMLDELDLLEQETGYIMDKSPTHYVSRSKSDDIVGENEKKEKHEFPALSMAKTKKISELQAWAGSKDIWLSWKLDGLTLVLTYDNGILTKIVTRGNGIIGTNITYFKNAINGFPISISYLGHMVVRGEATISYADFDAINEEIAETERYANPRNLAAGSLGLDASKVNIVKSRKISFTAFSLVYIDQQIISWGERLKFLDKLGFNTVERENTIAVDLPVLIEKWSKKVDDKVVKVPVDGLVICYDDTIYASTGNVTGHHATRAGLAFKWADNVAITTLKRIEWSCSISTITPIAIFDPVLIEGTMVSRASLCNISELERLGLGIDGKTKLQIIKANKIIPKCVGIIGDRGNYPIPQNCPVCHSPTEIVSNREAGAKFLRCTNSNCPAKHLSKFERFVSKKGMNIEGVSQKTLLTLINKGVLVNFDDVYSLSNKINNILSIDGFGEKSINNMIKAIEKSKNVNPINFIYALCIPMIGIDAAKRIVAQLGFEGFLEYLKTTKSFTDIKGIGEEKSKAITTWYDLDDSKRLLHSLLEIVTITQLQPSKSNINSCENLIFVITGRLNAFQSRLELVDFIEKRGGRVTSVVSKSTNYLINNDISSTSEKNLTAKKLGITIISEQEFLTRFSE